MTGVHPSANCPGGDCQPNVAELEFHEAGNKPGVMMLNTGTDNRSWVLTAVDFNANSGGQTPANPAWKAVDGKLLYADYSEGWDANGAPASTLPSPPPVPALPTGTNHAAAAPSGGSRTTRARDGTHGPQVPSTPLTSTRISGHAPPWASARSRCA